MDASRRRAPTLTPVPTRRRWPLLLAGGLLVAGLAVALVLRSPDSDRPAFRLLGTVSQAAAQPTARGRRLHVVHPFGGRILAGYGDYGANTGPIDVVGLDAKTGTAQRLYTAATEEISVIERFRSGVLIPHIDPRRPSDREYTLGPPWRSPRPLGALHVYDALPRPGGELFLSGSVRGCRLSCGRVWRSKDGGATWSVSFTEERPYPASYRCFGLGALGREVLVGCQSGAYEFDGTRWAPARALGTSLAQDALYDDRLVYASSGLYREPESPSSGLFAYDGTESVAVYPGQVFDVTRAGRDLYVLEPEGIVRRTSDLDRPDWRVVADGPDRAVSLATYGKRLVLGTTDSRIYVSGPIVRP